MAKITKDTLIGDLLNEKNQDELSEALMNIGMHCFHCAIASNETVGQAAEVHGVDVKELLKTLNEIASK
jgi:hybrid cluster-associated redox disulfide protein